MVGRAGSTTQSDPAQRRVTGSSPRRHGRRLDRSTVAPDDGLGRRRVEPDPPRRPFVHRPPVVVVSHRPRSRRARRFRRCPSRRPPARRVGGCGTGMMLPTGRRASRASAASSASRTLRVVVDLERSRARREGDQPASIRSSPTTVRPSAAEPFHLAGIHMPQTVTPPPASAGASRRKIFSCHVRSGTRSKTIRWPASAPHRSM